MIFYKLKRALPLLATLLARDRVFVREKVEPVELPAEDSPEVSIVVPVYNKMLYTYTCLASIAENTSDVRYEVVVVDDNSSDDTQAMLSAVANVRSVRNEENLGFVKSCNKGASMARGDKLVFLNNDTVVRPGWLSALAQTIAAEPDAGIAGAKLLFANLRLQDAGGIVWRDGTSWIYGRFDDPKNPKYNRLREVDYCSGCCLMIRRDLFERIGGFDTRFAPGYWEDVDLCFSARAEGYKVYFQPRSEIVHFEGITAGRTTSSGMKQYQVVNGEKFREKWQKEISDQYEKNDRNLELACDRSRSSGAGR